MKVQLPIAGLAVVACLGHLGCSNPAAPLASYEGDRPLILLTVTQSSAPEIQWVGGRAAAVGVNLGAEPGLNSSLVWVMTSDEDDISSPVRVGDDMDAALISSVGGTASDSLPSGADYTYWIATKEALDAGLEGADEHNYVDTTAALNYLLRGRSGGDPALGVAFTVVRDQTIIDDRYTVYWTPTDQPVRRMAIRKGTLGGFTDLIWHIVQPEGEPDGILPPVVIGELPTGTLEVVPWSGFDEATNYVLWGNTSDWEGDSFGFRTPGYVFYQIFANNFE